MLGSFAFPTLVPDFISKWNLSNTDAGWINGIFFGSYALFVPILASATDRIDGRRIYIIFATIVVGAWIGFGLFADDFWSALFFRALGGVGIAGTFLPGLKALIDRVGSGSQSRAISWYTASFSLGTSVSYFVTGKVNVVLGWQWVFYLSGIGAIVALLLVVLCLKPKAPTPPIHKSHFLDVRPVLRNRAVMAYVLAYAAHGWELFGVRTWLVAFLTFSMALNTDDSDGLLLPATIAALAALVAMAASIGGEEMAMRFGRIKTLTIVMWGSAILGASIGFTAALPYLLVATLCIVYSIFVQADSAALHAGVIENTQASRLGITMALQSVIGFSCAFLSPLIFGVVLDASGGGQSSYSWGAAFMVGGLVVALGPLVLMRISKKMGSVRSRSDLENGGNGF